MPLPLPPPPSIVIPAEQPSSLIENKTHVSEDIDVLDKKDDNENLDDESSIVQRENLPERSPERFLDKNKDVILSDELGHHIIIFSGDNSGFGDVIPPLKLGNPTIIPTSGDAEDHDHMDPRYQSFLKGEAILWDEFLAHKYRTNSIALWNWQKKELIIEIEGDRTVCDIDTSNTKGEKMNKDWLLNRDDIEQCLSHVNHSEDIPPTNFSND